LEAYTANPSVLKEANAQLAEAEAGLFQAEMERSIARAELERTAGRNSLVRNRSRQIPLQPAVRPFFLA
jgi:uncharacterized protein (DUF3084 family)